MKCYICKEKIEPIVVLENFKNGCHIKRCPLCDITFVHPQPDLKIIKNYYNGMYSDLTTEFSEQKMKWAKKSVKGYSSILKKHGINKKCKVLDVGGGLGYYSKAFFEEGYDVTLVEHDPVSVNFAQDVLNVPRIKKVSMETFFNENKEKFNVVFLRHVIEHSIDPAQLIEQINNYVLPGGLLIIETDNNAGIEILFSPGAALFYLRLYKSSFKKVSFLKLLTKRPFAVDPPRHLFGFRMSNLSMLLENNFLHPVEKIHYRLGHPIFWPNLPLPLISTFINDIKHLKLKSIIVDVISVVLFPFRLCLEKIGLTSGICIFAKKERDL